MSFPPGSKLKHFKKIHERTGIPYDEMVIFISPQCLLADRLKFSQLFFDDEHRNSEVESLGMFSFKHTSTRSSLA